MRRTHKKDQYEGEVSVLATLMRMIIVMGA